MSYGIRGGKPKKIVLRKSFCDPKTVFLTT